MSGLLWSTSKAAKQKSFPSSKPLALNFPAAISPLSTFWVVTWRTKSAFSSRDLGGFLTSAAGVSWAGGYLWSRSRVPLTRCLLSMPSLSDSMKVNLLGRFSVLGPRFSGLSEGAACCWGQYHPYGNLFLYGLNLVPSTLPRALRT